MKSSSARRRITYLCMTVVFISCDLTRSSQSGISYPTNLEPLTSGQLNSKLDEYQSLNDGRICSGLNKYGLTSGSGCYGTTKSNVHITRQKAISIAKAELYKNREFTNVTDTTQLAVHSALMMPTPIHENADTEWRVCFEDQKYEGMVVQNTITTVWLQSQGAYRIDGYWYKDIYIPDKYRMDMKTALGNVVGDTIKYSDFGGRTQSYIVKEASLPTAPISTSIVPFRDGENIQLHVTWQIPVPAKTPMWNLYEDVMDGKLLTTEQLFMD